jgi:hypothetical protein
MGVDLKLLPVECDQGTWGFAHTMLEIGRPYPLYEEIDKLTIERPDFNFYSFVARIPDGPMADEFCYGQITATPYGEPITYIKRVDLIKAMETEKVPYRGLVEHMQEWLGEQGMAALAYLKCLSCEWVALFYH